MSTPPAKKAKTEDQPICPYGSKCYRKNPAHFKEFSHAEPAAVKVTTTDADKTLPVCPFGATCYRKNMLHFAQFTHPFDLLNPDVDSSDEDEEKKTPSTVAKDAPATDSKKRKIESDTEDDGDKTEEYDSDDEAVYDVKLEKTYSKMTDEEKRLMIERAFELKDKLQEKLKKSREEAEVNKKEIEQLQHKMSEGGLLMEGELEILKGTEMKYFELFPERSYKQGSAAEMHFRLAESQFYRLLHGQINAQVVKVEYVCNPTLINRFNEAREELKKRGEACSYPVLAFHGTAMANIQPICETGFKVPGDAGFKHATDDGFWGRGTYFSEYPNYSMGYIKGATKLLLCQILQGKVFQCTQLINGAALKDGFDSHCSPNKKELIIFHSDRILPQYIVHYKTNTGEFKYSASAATKEALQKKLAKIGKLYKKAVGTADKKIFTGYKFALIGQMADTPLAIEALIKRFGGHVCKNAVPFGTAPLFGGLFVNGFQATTPFDAPNVLICSKTEFQAATPSAELQAYKNMGYQNYHREDFLYDSIIQGALATADEYLHE